MSIKSITLYFKTEELAIKYFNRSCNIKGVHLMELGEWERLQKENELLMKCLSELVESIYTPYRLGLAEKPNENWEALNKAKDCLAKLEK